MATAPVLLVHGGAGRIPPERQEEARAGCLEAARLGHAALLAGEDALEAVVRAVAFLEDHPAFNAGRGAALTRAGTAELDAAVMRGGDRAAGGVAALRRTRNPVRLARLVLDSADVLVVGEGADALAAEHGLEQVDPAYFVTERSRERLQEVLGGEYAPGGGTVGAVALDAQGHVAAATSTGGRVAQRPGRVGDAPIVGAGTYADALGAASGTGMGEFFMRALTAYTAVQGVPGLGAQTATERAIVQLAALGGEGGLILVGPDGGLGIAFNSPQMAHAWVRGAEEFAGV